MKEKFISKKTEQWRYQVYLHTLLLIIIKM